MHRGFHKHKAAQQSSTLIIIFPQPQIRFLKDHVTVKKTGVEMLKIGYSFASQE